MIQADSFIIQNLRHHFLVATDRLNGTPFHKSVIYVCQHDDREGAMGVKINTPSNNISFNDVVHSMGIEDMMMANLNRHPAMLNGGPVESNKGIVIHTPDYRLKNSVDIGPGVTLSATGSIVQDIARGVGPQHMNFCLGYSGWQIGQLEQEIAENDWLVVPATNNILFNVPLNDRYNICTQMLGLNALNFGTTTTPVGTA